MKKVIKRLVTVFYKPVLEKYLSKTRNYSYGDIQLTIPSEVFHPGFFFSTKLLIRYIKALDIKNKTFLELGAGSGLISIFAAKKNAIVTAIDINPVAIQNLKINSVKNDVDLKIIQSDMFKNVPKQKFDIVIIAPPYYKRDPSTYRDHAWYCGENGEYFQGLFSTISDYIKEDSHVAMILSEDCDLSMINDFAEKNNFKMDCVEKHKNLMEENFIYRIKPVSKN